MSKQHKIIFGTKSQTGVSLEHNTDAALDFPIMDGHVFAVSDGHDGVEGYGALAAKLCVDSIKKYFLNKSYKNLVNALTNAIVFANFNVHELAGKEAKYQGIGATVAVVIYYKNQIYYAYAGDSRIYAFQQGKLQLLTRDHISEDQQVQNLVGREKDIRFGVSKSPVPVEEDQVLLLCTDGLSDVLADDVIAQFVGDEDVVPEHKALKLLEEVRAVRGADHATVTVVEKGVVPEVLEEQNSGGGKQNLWVVLALVVLVPAIGFGLFKGYQWLASSGDKALSEQHEPEVKKKKVKAKPVAEAKQSKEAAQANAKDEHAAAQQKPAQQKPATPPAAKPAAKPDFSRPVMYQHKVSYGQNLYRLSLWYNISQDRILELNGENARNLRAETYLKIPVRAVYKVKANDTMGGISQYFGVPQQKIEQANAKGKAWTLRAGDEIVIPLP